MNTYTVEHSGIKLEQVPLDILTSQLQMQGLIVLQPHEHQHLLKQFNVSGSLPYAKFMSEVYKMHKLHDNCKFGLAEKLRDELCDELDNLMRFGGNDQ